MERKPLLKENLPFEKIFLKENHYLKKTSNLTKNIIKTLTKESTTKKKIELKNIYFSKKIKKPVLSEKTPKPVKKAFFLKSSLFLKLCFFL